MWCWKRYLLKVKIADSRPTQALRLEMRMHDLLFDNVASSQLSITLKEAVSEAHATTLPDWNWELPNQHDASFL